MTLWRSNYLHLLPVVRKLSAAIQTSHVGPGQSRGLRTALCTANGNRKAVPRVPAAEKNIHQFGDHDPTFHIHAGWLARPWVLLNVALLNLGQLYLGQYCLDHSTLSARSTTVCAGHHSILWIHKLTKQFRVFCTSPSRDGNLPRNPCTGYSYRRRKNVSRALTPAPYTLCGPRFLYCWHLVMMADRRRPRRSSGNS